VALNRQKLELTWIGKENRPRLEPRILMEPSSPSPVNCSCSFRRLRLCSRKDRGKYATFFTAHCAPASSITSDTAAAPSISDAPQSAGAYDLGAFQALEVPEESILAHGTADACTDMSTQVRFEAAAALHADLLTAARIRAAGGLSMGNS
jgi:hypothetical protein